MWIVNNPRTNYPYLIFACVNFSNSHTLRFLEYLEQALGLDQKIGVKGEIKKLRKQVGCVDC
ncbi:hypothetical protein BKK51_05165 [Rodentibacter trehalosifermentans]|uniref:Uncharacterized protein n=1 Tax=Rodentibacter trehalosifermentans TaxID=1908263 RepID=A0A1V3IZU5_9PAST|nr:hypothetical protein BKK51_05165 [Rodentibacter trehalosifermentans]OOF47948.1 hypothetical protein BKK52_07280 [Rodentibacter trehalosifermentans]OOF53135.1 hypothetical protein BKK53_02245 [Rodentibacter trehalosifermentans]